MKNLIKIILSTLVIGIVGCANLSSQVNEVVAYAPPFTVAKMTAACSQEPADAISIQQCQAMQLFAKFCAADISTQAIAVNTAVTTAGKVASTVGGLTAGTPIGAAGTTVALGSDVAVATNTALVAPAIEAQQLQLCTLGGFPMSSPSLITLHNSVIK
jgi:hypothetical protein